MTGSTARSSPSPRPCANPPARGSPSGSPPRPTSAGSACTSSESDYFHLLVFVEDGRVVRAFEHDQGGGSFTCLAGPVARGGLTPTEALLEVAESPAADGGSIAEVFLAQPRNAREARRTEECVETYS